MKITSRLWINKDGERVANIQRQETEEFASHERFWMEHLKRDYKSDAGVDAELVFHCHTDSGIDYWHDMDLLRLCVEKEIRPRLVVFVD